MWSSFSDANTYAAPFLATIHLTLAIFKERGADPQGRAPAQATHRTLTRFIAAILIAIPIEALILVFKFAIDKPSHLRDAA